MKRVTPVVTCPATAVVASSPIIKADASPEAVPECMAAAMNPIVKAAEALT